MKKYIIFLVIGMLSIALFAADPEQAAASKVATEGYKAFLAQCLTDVARASYRMSDEQRVENAELGQPLRLMQLPPDKIMQYKPESRVSSLLEPVNTFLFPVIFNGKIKLLMSVDKYPGRTHYAIGSLGYVHLAQEIGAMLGQWPADKGFIHILCVNFQTQRYGFSIMQRPDNLTLFNESSRDKRSYRDLAATATTIAVIKEQLVASLRKGD